MSPFAHTSKNTVASWRILGLLTLLSATSPVAFAATATDVGMIDVTASPYNATPGNANDDDAQAIEDAVADGKAASKPVYFPTGTYHVSRTINLVESGRNHDGAGTIQLIGATGGSSRPVIRLKNNSTDFNSESTPKPVVKISATDGPNVGYRNIFRGIDIHLGTAGNAGAVGIDFDNAQHSLLEDVTIIAKDPDVAGSTSAFAGVTAVPGRGMAVVNIRVVGGKHGLRLASGSLGAVLAGLTLENQTGAALVTRIARGGAIAGLKVVKAASLAGPGIQLITGPSGAPAPYYYGNISLTDAEFDMQNGAPAIDNTDDRFVGLKNVFVRGTTKIVDNLDPDTGDSFDPDLVIGSGNAANWSRVGHYAYNPDTNFTLNGTSVLLDNATNSTVLEFAATLPNDLVSRHVWGTTKSFVDATAVLYPDANTDSDHERIQAALNANTVVYLAKGRYELSEPITLNANNVLMGVPGYYSILEPTSTLEYGSGFNWLLKTVDDANATTVLQDMGFDTPGEDLGIDLPPTTSQLGAIQWMAGRNSIVRGIRAYFAPSYEQSPRHHFRIQNGGGGRWYSLSDHAGILESDSSGNATFRKLDVRNTSQPLTFYGLNLEHGGGTDIDPQTTFMEVQDSSNIRIFGMKTESDGDVITCSGVDNMFVGIMMGNVHHAAGSLLVLNGSANTRIEAHGLVWPGTNNTLVDDGSTNVSRNVYFLGLYRKGFVDYSQWEPAGAAPNNPPTVSISEPANQETIQAFPTSVKAMAADSDGFIAGVGFDVTAGPGSPTDLGFDSSPSYEVIWSPVAAGNYTLVAEATDDGLATTTSAPIAVTVVNQVPLIATTSLPAATAGVPYNQSLAATGDGTVSWSDDGGTLPNWLSLSVAGTLTGTPPSAQTVNFTVRAADADLIVGAGDEDTQAYTLVVNSSGGGGDVTINRTVGASTDDDETTGGIVSSDLELGNTFVGVRFTNISIPQGKTIVSARLTFTRESSGATTNAASVTVFGEDRNNAATFVNGSSEPFDRTRTTASVGWSIASGGAAGATRVSPELKSIVQEIVNRAGWASGNAMVFLLRNDSGRWDAASWDDSATAPQLEITYTP